MPLNMLNLWVAKGVKKDRGRGVKQLQIQGDEYRATAGLNPKLRNEGNNHITTAIDHMIDVPARLIKY